jgi:hypothetical protein
MEYCEKHEREMEVKNGEPYCFECDLENETNVRGARREYTSTPGLDKSKGANR